MAQKLVKAEQKKLEHKRRKEREEIFKMIRGADPVSAPIKEPPKKKEKSQKDKFKSIDRSKFQLNLFKPNIDYIVSEAPLERDRRQIAEASRPKVQSSINISNDRDLDRVLSRSFYGKWYVDPDRWSELQLRAVNDHNLDATLANSKRDAHTSIAGGRPRKP